MLTRSRRSPLWIVAALVAAAAVASAATAEEFFADEELHDVWIHINARDWRQLRDTFNQNTYYTCDLEWQGVRVNNVGIRSRGAGSRNGSKPGFQLDFGRYAAGQTFAGLTGLVLDNHWQDPSMVKERVAMRFFARMGQPAPREAHVRLFVGSQRQYAGVYAMVEPIDERFLQRHFGEASGHLYEYTWIDAYHFEDLGSDLEPYAMRFSARTDQRASMFDLFAPIRDAILAMNDASPWELERRMSPHLDLDAFVAHVAVENFLSEADGILGGWGLSNFYLYRSPAQAGARVIVWDKDNTFTSLDTAPADNVAANVLMAKAWAVPRLRALYLQTLLDSAAAADGWLEADVLRYVALIRNSALADPLKPYSNEEFERSADEVARFARERSAMVRRLATPLLTAVNGTSRTLNRRLPIQK